MSPRLVYVASSVLLGGIFCLAVAAAQLRDGSAQTALYVIAALAAGGLVQRLVNAVRDA